MVLGLHPPFQHPQFSPGIERSRGYNLQQGRFAQMVRAGAGHQHSARAEQFQRAPVNLPVSANRCLQALARLRESRRVQDDDVEMSVSRRMPGQ